MKPPTEKRNGGSASRATAIANPAKDVDALGESVKNLRLTRWMDMAIVMHRMGATDPAEYQRLGIWLHRMRRGVV